MRTKVLSANQRIVIGVADEGWPAKEFKKVARMINRVGLTLEVEQKGDDLVMFAARRVVTNDISVPQAARRNRSWLRSPKLVPHDVHHHHQRAGAMTKAMMRYGGSLTVADVLLIELPHFTPEDREYALWEYTGYPCFFTREPHPIAQLRQQLRDVREGTAKTTDDLYTSMMKAPPA